MNTLQAKIAKYNYQQENYMRGWWYLNLGVGILYILLLIKF